MKNKQNGFYKTNSNGISLIVLIITIIVIIILATAILVSVINNNPISEANKARYESDRDNMQAVFTNTVASIMSKELGTVNVTAGQINTETTGVNETTGEVAYTVDNAVNEANASGTIKFDKGTNDATTYYTGKKLPIYAAGETKWYVDSEGVLSLEVAEVKYGSGEIEEAGAEPSAAAVAAAPTTYYGATVTNYETGDSTIDSQVDWQIFHSDGNNIYLIATDYISGTLAPAGKGGTAVNFSDTRVWFSNVYADYNGSEDVTDTTLQALNSKYYKYLTDNNTTSGENDYNMQTVAYLMDTSDAVWGKFEGEDAAYAIGGPTLEIFLDSYNNKKGTNYQCKVESAVGYMVSPDGTSWSTWFEGLDTTDTQYVLPSYSMYLASPSAGFAGYLFVVNYNGSVLNIDYNRGTNCGVRPLVCLNSNVALEAVEGGFAIK